MPVETWFPSVVFFEDIELDLSVRSGVLEAIEEKTADPLIEKGGRVTADDISNDFHLDDRVATLFGVLAPTMKDFFFTHLGIDPTGIEFFLGRCWPVVLENSGGDSGAHTHGGAVFSGVFYLQVPEGAGGLHFSKPFHSTYDDLDKAEMNALNFVGTIYPAVENRLVLFSSDLVHRREPNADGCEGSRIAIAFDIYTMVDPAMKGAGMPRYELLRRLL